MTIEEWNAWYLPGHPVIVTKDDGTEVQTNTRSEAWDLCGTPVVLLDGISGGYRLSRCKPMETHP